LLPQFLKFILFALFFVQKKSAAKEVKKRAVLSLRQFCFLPKLLAPPRVRFLLSQKLLGTTAHFRHLKIFAFCKAALTNNQSSSRLTRVCRP
jgi:hypothetical protein